MREPFSFAGVSIAPGSHNIVEIPISVMSDHTPVTMSVDVWHGRKAGPTLFVSAAIHGDEIIGVEVVRRLLQSPRLNRLCGTLIAVPIVNSFGFINHSRYLPDRRDLNRSFPGSEGGSLAGRLAHKFLTHIVDVADMGIDIHSAAIHRTNLPQIRIAPHNDRLLFLANSFAAPVILTSPLREGSLRESALKLGVDMLLYEAGEGLRFDERAIRTGVSGVLRVMGALGMFGVGELGASRIRPILAKSSYWLRAPSGGLLRSYKTIGDLVSPETTIGVVADPFGAIENPIQPTEAGLIIGRSNLPLVNEGDAIFHIARVADAVQANSTLVAISSQLNEQPLFDEDEII